MKNKWFSLKMIFLVLVSGVFLLLSISPAQAYNYGNWDMDGYFKSQFGIFTEQKPYNKPKFGGSDDNTATAKQMFRWNMNGSITSNLALRAEVLAVWEPDYPGEKGVRDPTDSSGATEINANYYNSFDWRELTLEYKPSPSHTIKFGRQILNWGESLSGRVIDQINPDDSRSSSGFVNLEERYMPLWMFRGNHDFYSMNSSIEWIVAPIWQANRYEHSRSVSGTTPQGDGKWVRNAATFPSARFTARRENRTQKIYGADYIISFAGSASSIVGAPYSSFYHGSDLLPGYVPGTPIRALTRAEIIAGGAGVALGAPSGLDPDTRFSILKEIPVFLPTDYTDHNMKNTRWGVKTKSLLGPWEGGVAFFQAPGFSATTVYRSWGPYSPYPYSYANKVYLQYVYPRYNTFGIYGNRQFNFGIFSFESAYLPDREYTRFQMGIGRGPDAHEQRLNNIKEVDSIQTLLGFTREQNIPFLNKFNVFTFRAQYTATNYLDDVDDVSAITTFYMKNEQMEHSVIVSTSTAYSYNKYAPSLTLSWYPKGAWVISPSFTYTPEGFNGRLKLSLGYTNYWTANEFTTAVSLYDNHDAATFGLQYNFY